MRMPDQVSDPPRPFRGLRATKAAKSRRGSRKRATNVSINEELLAEARAKNLNLSQTLEDALRAALREDRMKRFEEEHRDAFESYNRFIEENGLWNEDYRKW